MLTLIDSKYLEKQELVGYDVRCGSVLDILDNAVNQEQELKCPEILQGPDPNNVDNQAP